MKRLIIQSFADFELTKSQIKIFLRLTVADFVASKDNLKKDFVSFYSIGHLFVYIIYLLLF